MLAIEMMLLSRQAAVAALRSLVVREKALHAPIAIPGKDSDRRDAMAKLLMLYLQLDHRK